MQGAALVLLVVSGALTTPAQAQEPAEPVEPEFFLEVMPPAEASPIGAVTRMALANATLSMKGVQQVIRVTALPDTSSGPIVVCFRDGAAELRREVTKHARVWELPDTSVLFDFGDPNLPRTCGTSQAAMIRISFKGPGTWAVVGTEARVALGATMNFDGGRNWLSVGEREFRRVVQHEFGHALGLYHEHQHPEAMCIDEIDWPSAYELFRSAQFNLSNDEIRRNFEGLLSKYATTPYDERSIMLYDLPRKVFKRRLFDGGTKPSCYREDRVYELSGDDMAAIAKYYPVDRDALLRIRRDAFESLRTALSASPDSGGALAIAAALYPFDNPADAKTYVDFGRTLLKVQARQPRLRR